MITDVDDLYFAWLMDELGAEGQSVIRLCSMLHNNTFERSVGNDVNRAVEGVRLRQVFMEDFSDADIDPRKLNSFLDQNCSWLEMLVALCASLDYTYDGGVLERFLELVGNLGLNKVLMSPLDGRYDEVDQDLVDMATVRVDKNRFDANGRGGLFPLSKSNHPDQREVEIWDQHAAYFSEQLEGGAMWTSIS